MLFMQKIAITIFVLCMILSAGVHAQKRNKKANNPVAIAYKQPWKLDTLITPIHISRQLYVDRLEKTIDNIDLKDGANDTSVSFRNEETTSLFTKAFMADVPRIIILIENLKMEQNETIKYYRALQEKLTSFQAISWDTLPADFFTSDLNNLRELIIAQYQNDVSSFVSTHLSLSTLNNISLLKDNSINVSDYEDSKPLLYKALAKKYPEIIMQRLIEIKDQPYTDTIVADIAQVQPNTILWYAQNEGEYGRIIKRNGDQLVQTIVRISEASKTPEKILPFLGPINRGDKNISEVVQFTENNNKYFQGLVDLTLNDEQVCKEAIAVLLESAINGYAEEINKETLPDYKRFEPIQGLRDVDYYMIIVDGKDLLSANTFINGVFPLLSSSLGSKSGVELLQQTHNYKFRTFLRLCAENNTLELFLKTMTKPEKNILFKDFSSNLESGILEDMGDAIEVAITYQYLKDSELTNLIRKGYYNNYERVKAANNENTSKGILTYGLLHYIFEYKYDKSNAPFFDSFGVTQIPFRDFVNDKNEIIEQVYFYPDADGKNNLAQFLNTFKNNSAWHIEDSKNWIKLSSSSGDAKTIIYANKATVSDSATNVSINALNDYLQKNNITPVVIYNFSPIYNLSKVANTIGKGTRVVLSACSFGDDNIMRSLYKNQDIHILGSHLTITGSVEMKVFFELNKQLGYGRNLNWNDMWRDLESYYTDIDPTEKAVFNNFIQPNLNYGELFAKTYIKTLSRLRSKKN